MTGIALSAFFFATAGAAHGNIGDQITALFGPDESSAERFGIAVDIDNGTAIVGSNRDTPGAAYLFDLNSPGNPNHLTLIPIAVNTNGTDFGLAVAIGGNRAVVGAPELFTEGHGRPGAAFLFDAETGEQITIMIPDDGADSDLFGHSVAIDSGTIIVGAYQANTGLPFAGAAYLFDAATGQQLMKLVPDEISIQDQFGISVGISGSVAIVGANRNDDFGLNAGAAYLFDIATGDQLHRLIPSDGAAGDQFGAAVAIDGDYAVVGAKFADVHGANSGAAYIFDVSTGQQVQKIAPADGQAADQFGVAVALNGSIVVVGSEQSDLNSEDAGAAYLFEIESGDLASTLAPFFLDDGNRFGGSVGIDAEHAIVGAYRNDLASEGGLSVIYDARFVCPSDINADGVIDTADLGGLIGAFGNGGGAADINGDGVVDTADLGILIGMFGADCP